MAVHTLIHELPSRIAEKIEPDPNDCWLWTAYRNRAGYGLTRQRPFRTRLAHRIVWLLLRGSIPDGLHLDHLCRVRACVNPNHLRVVTCAENNLAEGAMGQGALKAQKDYKITRILSASVNYGTKAVEAAYVCVHHTDCEQDVRNLAGFIPTAEYGTRGPISEYELGTVEDTRYICSPDLNPILAGGKAVGSDGMVAADSTNNDVYPMLYIGKESYGIV
ncbi:hypothetical protein LCGC14_2749060, partial [marine sediment metagenome]